MAKKKKAEKPARIMTRRQESLHKRQVRRQRLIFIGGISVIAAIIVIVLVGWIIGEYMPMHATVIKIGDTEYDTEYLVEYIESVLLNDPDADVATLVDASVQQITQTELARRTAELIGIVVSDEDSIEFLEDLNMPVNDASIDRAMAQLLTDRVRLEFISPVVPVTDNQVRMRAMAVENESVANDVRNQLLNGANFTALAPEYALDKYGDDISSGDFGLHPRSILVDQVFYTVPLDYAFSAEAGSLSEPLPDKEISKKLGYWLIDVLERPQDDQAVVNAILFGSQELAEQVKPRLEAADNITAIAEEYNQYNVSEENGGQLGLLTREKDEQGNWYSKISPAFDDYAFSDNQVGVWSEPIMETQLWTTGGYWLVEVVERENDSPLTDEDRDELIDNQFNVWLESVNQMGTGLVDTSGLTDEIQQRILNEVSADQS